MIEIILRKYEVQYLFDAIPKNARHEIILNRGEYVFLQGDKTHGMFAVMDGKVQLQRHTQARVMVITHTAKIGETFAEASLFSDHFHCDAVAIEASRIVRFYREKLFPLGVNCDLPKFANFVRYQDQSGLN